MRFRNQVECQNFTTCGYCVGAMFLSQNEAARLQPEGEKLLGIRGDLYL
jgi:predicted metal-binding protein